MLFFCSDEKISISMNNLYQIYENFEKDKFPATSLTCKDILKERFLVFFTKVGKINIFLSIALSIKRQES